MKIIFLDIDGVLNSYQSATFWHNKRDQAKWENELYLEWHGTIREYIAREFDPIALSNLEELVRNVPDVKIVMSSTWRLGENVPGLKKIFEGSKVVSDVIIDKTPDFSWKKPRGEEIQAWLNEHPEVTHYVIIDDDRDMLDSQLENFVNTSSLHGFLWGDMLKAVRILGEEYK